MTFLRLSDLGRRKINEQTAQRVSLISVPAETIASMAHDQPNHNDRTHRLIALATSHKPSGRHNSDGEDLGADNDEPPDCQMKFSKMGATSPHIFIADSAQPMSPRGRKASLLTQAFTSPELGPQSDIEAPLLTSDGGMTSPARTNTPSPPLPTLRHINLNTIESNQLLDGKHEEPVKLDQNMSTDRIQEVKVEEELGRRRCISFACLQKDASQPVDDKPMQKATQQNNVNPTTTIPQKRPCILRFACPMKPSQSRHRENIEVERLKGRSQDQTGNQLLPKALSPLKYEEENSFQVSRLGHEASPEAKADKGSKAVTPGVLSASIHNQDRMLRFNRIDFQKSEATRFHEFAGSFADEGEWANEQTAFRQKITISDTLRKENAIRKLAEEAEEEAREEDDNLYENENDSLDEASDDGNESDDEEGFADSSDESDGGSAYQFWTPGCTTATTSIDQKEHIRPVSHRTISESSIESVIGTSFARDEPFQSDGKKGRKGDRTRKGTHSIPPELLDSSDFVVGTIDEDQLFEEELLSRMKQKERSRQKLIPQDIDPSFPTSDPEAERDDDDELENEDDDEEEEKKERVQNDFVGVLDSLQNSKKRDSAEEQSLSSANRNGQNPSPRRLHSPPPSHRLFGQAVHRFRSPPPLHRKLISPPSSRRPSFSGSPNKTEGINIARLAQRPNLTHTASLPRTPNPFWYLHNPSQGREFGTSSTGTSPKAPYAVSLENHRRGPIEIVQGLENRRQRRKEKLWRQQCSRAHAGKERERRCQPGKGAERMREVGLVMADRFKGYKQDSKFVLSV